MANENIGELGRDFIVRRTEIGIEFDAAWAEWQRISSALHFLPMSFRGGGRDRGGEFCPL